MRSTLIAASWLLHGIQAALGAVIATPIEREVQESSYLARRDLTQVADDLAKTLSANASVVFPDDPDWTDLLIRASSPRVYPHYSVVVEAATEDDVVKTVQAASSNDIPFLAISGSHAWTETLNRLPYGFQINLRKLNATTLDDGAETATVQGGSIQYEVTHALYPLGYHAVTGLAECVSIAGPLLGGGHSYLQGQYGYALDNLVSANVVLANGSLVTASNDSNSDLFWALRGAGHNFGIVTSLQLKVYPVTTNWTVYTFIYTQDQLEDVMSLVNYFELPTTDRPAKFIISGVFTRAPDVDAENPVIAYNVLYEGPVDEAAPYAAKFQALNPVVNTVDFVDYPYIYTLTTNSLDSAACRNNLNMMGYGANLPEWNLVSTRKAFNLFANATADPRFNTSLVLLENYGVKGVQAVNYNSTSLSAEERANPILSNPVFWWSGNDTQDYTDAHSWAGQIRDALFSNDTNPKHTYVNYAVGNEPLEQLYGYESWRVEKLKSLKSVWDPTNAFRWYAPLV